MNTQNQADIVFPRPTAIVGNCIAVIETYWSRPIGEPFVESAYKRLRWRGDEWLAHRLSYSLNVETIPRLVVETRPDIPRFILHHCDNKWCVNPTHLYLGTNKENTHDMWNRMATDKKEKHRRSVQMLFAEHDHAGKISRALKGVPKSDECKANMRIGAKKRKPPSTETRLKMSESAKARKRFKYSDETRAKMSTSMKEWWNREGKKQL